MPPAWQPHEPHTEPIPVDPWRGTARVPVRVPVAPPPARIAIPIEPQVIFVERPRRRRRWPWILAVLAVCAPIGALVGYDLAAPIVAQYPARVSVPADGAAGLTVSTGEEINRATTQLELQIHETVSVDDAFAYVLADPDAADQQVLFFGATLLILDPKDFITKAMRDLAGAAEIVSFDPGPLGGLLRCGNHTLEDGTPAVACAWVDHGSIAVGVFLGGRPMDESAALLRNIRADVLIRP